MDAVICSKTLFIATGARVNLSPGAIFGPYNVDYQVTSPCCFSWPVSGKGKVCIALCWARGSRSQLIMQISLEVAWGLAPVLCKQLIDTLPVKLAGQMPLEDRTAMWHCLQVCTDADSMFACAGHIEFAGSGTASRSEENCADQQHRG